MFSIMAQKLATRVSPSEPILRAIIENMILSFMQYTPTLSKKYCYMILLKILWRYWKSLEILDNEKSKKKIGKFGQFWAVLKILHFFLKITNYDFHSKRQIMTAGGVYDKKYWLT